jgi:hypothetical protein
MMQRAKQLFRELYPERLDGDGNPLFKFSTRWFDGFKSRCDVSLRRVTNKAQALPSTKVNDIRSFHLFIREQAANGNRVGPLGKWTCAQIANMDQTPMEFDLFTKDSTYETR